jgi:MFS family permease
LVIQKISLMNSEDGNLKNPKPGGRRVFYGWYLVAAAWLMSFMVSATAVGLYFKPLLDEFQWSRAQLSLVSSLTLLAFAALSPLVGRLIDRFGPRRMLLAATAAQILSALTYGLAHSLGAIYAGRLLYELKPTHGTQILINRWFTKKRGQALGILSSGLPVGQLVLSPISQYLITTWGWRNTFYFWAALTAVLVLPLFLFIKDQPQDQGLFPDGDPGPAPGVPLIPASPDQNSGLNTGPALRQPAFWLLAATHFICGISCGWMATHLVIMAVDLGYSAIIGASFLSVQGGVSLLGVLATGFLSDRLARRKVLSLTHLIRSLGLWIMVAPLWFGLNSPLLLYSAMVLFGFGWFTTSPLAAGLAADLFGRMRMGTLLGIILASHLIGMAVGSFAGGLSYQLSGSYGPILSGMAALEMLAAFLALNIRNRSVYD